MPRYYCDYCDTYLTHDSPSVRKQHNAGYKHKANVRSYYQQFEEQQTQSLIDQKVKEHLGQTAAYQQQVGAAFHQHLNTLQYKPPMSAPVLPPPPLPIPGTTSASSAPPLLPVVRPPVLPRPTGATPGFGVAPTFRPPVASTITTHGAQSNGLPRPPILAPPGAPGVRPVMSSSTASANGPLPGPPLSGPPGSFQQQSTPLSGSHGNYLYPSPQLGSSTGYMLQRPNLTPTANPTPTPTSNPTPSSTLNPNINPTYSSQQPSRVAPPGGSIAQSSLPFGQGTFGPSSAAQSTSSSYGPSPPGGPVSYRS